MAATKAIQAVIFDLDGTAVPSGFASQPTSALLAAIDQAGATGQLRLCAATGRSWEVGEDLLRSLKLTDPCVISGGTQIINSATAEVLWQVLIEPRSAQAIADCMMAHNYPTAYVRGLESTRHLRDFQPDGINTMYILNIPPTELDALMAKLTPIPDITISKAYSWASKDGIDLHITSHIATKEHAVHELAAMIGVPTSHMAGVGDGHNDIHLFNAVGHKVAMGNAVPELKAAADQVIGSVNEDGLATYITSLL